MTPTLARQPICATEAGLSPRDRLIALRRELDTAIAQNRAHRGDRLTGTILRGLTKQLVLYRLRIDSVRCEGDERELAITLGPNARGPHIARLIEESATHRSGRPAQVLEGFRVERPKQRRAA